MPQVAYLEADGTVRLILTADVDLTEVQNRRESSVTEKIIGVPAELKALGNSPKQASYHQKTSGDGTDIGHYTLQNLTAGSGTFNIGRFEATEETSGKVSAIKTYATDDGDGTYSDLVKEILYTWDGNNLTSEEIKIYFDNGVLAKSEKFDFVTTDAGEKVRKPA